MTNSKIEWTDTTWNPVRGCSMAEGSENGGCLNCYAARMASRNLPSMKSPTTGKPFARILQSGPRWTGDVELIESALPLPLHWQKPRRVFVNSMSDLFHEDLRDDDIDRVFAVMALSPRHTFQILTKRPERMQEYMSRKFLAGDVQIQANNLRDLHHVPWAATLQGKYHLTHEEQVEISDVDRWPLPHVWMGVSIEDEGTSKRIWKLLETPASVRFVSYEPALGPVDFDKLEAFCSTWRKGITIGRYLDWVIVGGESGPRARPFDVAWARRTIEQCRVSDVACFIKQLGAFPVYEREVGTAKGGSHVPLKLVDKKGGDWDEWPAELRVREFPQVATTLDHPDALSGGFK